MFGILEKNDEIEVRGALLDFVCKKTSLSTMQDPRFMDLQ